MHATAFNYFHFALCVFTTLLWFKLPLQTAACPPETNYLTGLREVSGCQADCSILTVFHVSSGMLTRFVCFPCVPRLSVRACLVRAHARKCCLSSRSLLVAPLVTSESFQGTCSNHLCTPTSPQKKQKKKKHKAAHGEIAAVRAGVFVCWSVAVCQGAKLFWIGPSHLVTPAETDRGVVGQSGVGVLNELSCIQPASVSRGMNEWPDSLFTSSFLSDFPDLLPPATSLPPLFNFVTLVCP